MQAALDFERREGMQQALANAERKVESWGDLAFEFLKLYARQHEFIFAEDVTKAADKWGLLSPPDFRAWGSLYMRARREGVMAITNETRKRQNGSLAMVYRSLLK